MLQMHLVQKDEKFYNWARIHNPHGRTMTFRMHMVDKGNPFSNVDEWTMTFGDDGCWLYSNVEFKAD